MSFTSRLKGPKRVFQAVTDMGTDARQDGRARLPIEDNHTYRGLLFDTDMSCVPTPRIHRFTNYEEITLEGCELEEYPLDKLTLMPSR